MHTGLVPFPQLKTQRLRLRQLHDGDAQEIFLLRSDVEHNRYINRPLATSIEDAKAFIKKINLNVGNGNSYLWAIDFENEQTLAGTILLWNIDKERNKAELGYELLPAYQGKGIIREALALITRFAFEQLQVNILEGWVHPENASSIAVLEKGGFKRDLEAEQHKPADAKEIIYSLRKDHW